MRCDCRKTGVAGPDLASYRTPMACKRFAVGLAALLLCMGCGDGATSFEASNPVSEALWPTDVPTGVADVEVSGNLILEGADRSLLVFVFADLTQEVALAESDPVNLASIAPDGRFLLSVPPAETITIVFLDDKAHDGAIDPDDAIAVLADPQQRLTGLGRGDRVLLSDIQLDFASGAAVAAGFEVEKASAPAPAATPTAATS
jgi:hypothetical protein